MSQIKKLMNKKATHIVIKMASLNPKESKSKAKIHM